MCGIDGSTDRRAPASDIDRGMAMSAAAVAKSSPGFLARLFRRGESVPATASDGGIRFGGSNGSAGYRDTSYAGASRIRKQLHNWQPSRATAGPDLLPYYDLLVARSRDLNRNNGVAAGAFQSLQDNAVGTGLRLACDPDYRALGRDKKWSEDWSRTTESLWRTWAGSMAFDAAGQQTFASLTQLVFRSALENGEALCLT